MRIALILILAMLLVPVVIAADVAGTWKGSMETPMGTMENIITFKLDGSTLTGTLKTDFFESKLETIKLDGANISFEINMEFGKISYAGTVEGEQMKLNVTGPDGNKLPLTLTKQK
jgi:hypothetical protein